MQLTTKQVSLPVMTPPVQYIPFIKPLTYEFRVAEVVDKEGKITTVKLQMQVWEHDEFGSGIVKQYWSDVPRYRFDAGGNMLPSLP